MGVLCEGGGREKRLGRMANVRGLEPRCSLGGRQSQPCSSDRLRLDEEFDEGLRIGCVERQKMKPSIRHGSEAWIRSRAARTEWK